MQQRYVSDELTHFVGRYLREQPNARQLQYELLLKILRRGCLCFDINSPSAKGCTEGLVPLSWNPAARFSAGDMYAPGCICFCDIPLADLPLHIEKYSAFGIAFRKEFLIAKGANPVFYLECRGPARGGANRSDYFDEMVAGQHRIEDVLRQELTRGSGDPAIVKVNEELERFWSFYHRDLMSFAKPFDASLHESDPDNFYMEREWRVLGNVAFRTPDVRRVVLPEDYSASLRADVPEYSGQLSFS